MHGPDPACGPILIVDDDDGFRSFAAAALSAGGLATAEASDADAAFAAADEVAPSVVLLDVCLPGLCGYEIARRLRQERPGVRIVFCSGVRTESFDRVAGFLLGADDYVVKPVAPDELVARVRAVVLRASTAAARVSIRLTPRELQVLEQLASGRTQKEIGRELAISSKTVGTHVEHILEKLQVRNRAQAIAVAYRDNIVRAG